MKFTIILPPKAQARDKIASIGGRATSYKAKSQRQEEHRILALCYEHKPPGPLSGALLFGVKAFLPIPKAKPLKWRRAALEGLIRPITKPDLSNLIKQVEDVFNGVFWEDDKQIVGYLETGKWYGDPARWEIEIKEI